MRLIADTNIPFLQGTLEAFFDVEYHLGDEISPALVRNADALLVRTRTLCNSSLLAGSSVRFIGSATIGFNHIDTDYCAANGIAWVNAPGCNSAGVQQWVAAALVHWAEQNARSLAGLTIGVVGVGSVGQRVVELARVLGMTPLCCDPPRHRNEHLPDFVDFKTVLGESDIISFHVPLSHTGGDKTLHLLNSGTIALCKPDVYLLNSSRGEVVSTGALLSFLEANRGAQAALDVWENEPYPSAELLRRVTIATPHIAGYSLEGKVMGTKMVVDALSQFFGLGISPWFPTPNPLIGKVALGDTPSVAAAVRSTYSILDDDLRSTPCSFEGLRNTYRYRRDFSGHAVGANSKHLDDLRRIGFSVSRE